MGLIVLWVKYFGPKPPVQPPQANRPAQTAPATPGQATSPVGNASPTSASPAALTPAAPVSVTPKSDSQERTIVVTLTGAAGVSAAGEAEVGDALPTGD